MDQHQRMNQASLETKLAVSDHFVDCLIEENSQLMARIIELENGIRSGEASLPKPCFSDSTEVARRLEAVERIYRSRTPQGSAEFHEDIKIYLRAMYQRTIHQAKVKAKIKKR